MNKPLFLITTSILLLITLQLIIATDPMSNEDFQKKLNQLKETGDLTDISSNIDSLSDAQRTELITEIKNSPKFWTEWNKLNLENKKVFWKKLNQEQKDSFMSKYGEYLGLPADSINGFNENIGLGEGGIIGNQGIFLNGEDIKEYNSKNKDKIVSIEYKSEEGKGILVVTKESGASATVIAKEVPGEKDAKAGYYFDAKTGKFYRLNKNKDGDFIADEKDSLSGKWNGKGHLTIDASGEETKINLDYNRKDGKTNKEDYAEFVTSNKDVYTVFQNPSGEKDKDGNKIYDLNKAEITFDKDGKLKSLSNVYKTWEGDGKKWGGFFNGDWKFFDSEEEYNKLSEEEKAKINPLILDEKTGFLKTDVRRSIGGHEVGGKEYAQELRKNLEKMSKDMQGKVKNLERILELRNPTDDKGKKRALTFKEVGEKVALETGLGFTLANSLGVKVTDPLIASLSSDNGLRTLSAFMEFSGKGLDSANEIVLGKMESLFKEADSSIFGTPVGGADSQIHLSNEMAKVFKHMDLRVGGLSIGDSNGNLFSVVDLATPFNYKLAQNFNKDNPYFKGINFNLINENIPEQQFQIYSDSEGKLQTQDLENLKGVGSRIFNAQGTLFTGPRGGIAISQGDGMFKIGLDVDEETARTATEYITQAREEYDKQYHKLEEGGISKKENHELNLLATKITNNYYDILNKGNSNLYINSLSVTKPEEFGNSINKLADKLDASNSDVRSDSFTQSPAAREMIQDTISKAFLDYQIQEQLIQRELYAPSKIREAVDNQKTEISSFLRRNSGDSLQIIQDKTNKVYQIKYGSETLNLDPLIGGIACDQIVKLAGSGGLDSNNQLYFDNDIWKSRLQGHKTETISISMYHPLRGILRAKSSLEAQAKGMIQQETMDRLRTPQ